MRRFIDTIAGRAFCHLAVMALVLPTVTLTMASRAEAQVTQLPSWAVTEFKDLHAENSRYGQIAADAVAGELAKTNKYDVVAQDTVKRSIETLGISSPPEGLVNLSRLGQDIRATVIVKGELVDYQVRAVGGGKQAIVVMRTVAYNVASGLPVNGAYEKGESTIRSGNVTNDALITDAIAQAAAGSVIKMQGQQLPTATVLNTTTRTALINQGARSGFKTGDTVILTRGAVQVGTARIGSVEPDQAEITFERVIVGVAPGDRVNAVFTVPSLPPSGIPVIRPDGKYNGGTARPRGRSNNATLISALLVVGLAAVLLSGGNASQNGATSEFKAEAQTDIDGISPSVRLSWSTNGFFKGSEGNPDGVKLWQIYRSDVSLNPIMVVGGGRGEAIDSTISNRTEQSNYAQFNRVGGTTCDFTSPTTTALPTVLPLAIAGKPYFYQLEAVYSVSQGDLPGTSTGGNTTTNSGGNTTTNSGGNTTTNSGGNTTTNSGGNTTTNSGGNTTTNSGGNTTTNSGTSSNGQQLCYFTSSRSTSGLATPLTKPTPTSPLGLVSSSQLLTSFQFTSSTNGNATINALYVIEFSNKKTFPKGSTVRTPESSLVGNGSLSISVTLNDQTLFPTSIRNASPVYYRIGVRNGDDRPGPKPVGPSKQRYIYSNIVQFTRQLTNPGTP